ncbi:hypothetical protein ACFOON_06675 [Novosphingobium piscinae]|uniref:Uncharacterized protein n=1 Tax=Novosphingobium piscinae TaxID=1507448 RepID=A0A7X1FWQ1_9SPHN|nr:hypothetical protein [Novosphingobium piscinae]MBC2668408.1 hypothetical protein [Novosphingobium piscinae]
MLSLGKSQFWRNASPTGAIADFREVWRQAGVRRWPFVAAALATTLGVFYVIVQESWQGPPPKPRVTYINSWTIDRTDAEIEREIIANQKLQDRLRAEQAAREEKVKAIYRTLGKVSGLDTAKIEREAAAQAAREKAAHDRAIGLAPRAAKTSESSAGR